MFKKYFSKRSKKIIKILDTGYFYTPYIPIMSTPTVVNNSFLIENNKSKAISKIQEKEDKSIFDNLYFGPDLNIETEYIKAIHQS